MAPLTNDPNHASRLAGKRIVITAYDLEQSEHRGIAVYSKALIRSLREKGAEVWLLTEFDFPMRSAGLHRLPAEMQELLHSAKVLDSLAEGDSGTATSWLEKKINLAGKFRKYWRWLEDIWEFARRPRYYPARKIKKIRLNKLFDNPYLRHDRLGYLQYVEGILCARKIFFSTQVAALLKSQKPVRIDLKGFDALLTCCPLNIKPLNTPTFVQTVHDLIPIEYAQTSDNLLGFSHRLQACLPAKRIFVSESTAVKFHERIKRQTIGHASHKTGQRQQSNEKILVQPPSLIFPSWLAEDPNRVSDLRPVSHLLRKKGKRKEKDKEKEREKLEPFKFLLFNSSVEARKNLLFLVKAYSESNLGSKGIRLCVTGKLKKDNYSKAVREIVMNEPGILLAGYIDESTKLDLYLNAMALLSPSLVEGFGIPVLDASCLGMPAIASNCDSHQEIQTQFDFKQYVLLINTLESRDWAAAMQSVYGISTGLCDQPSEERKRRISRYQNKYKLINRQFQNGLEELIE